MVDSTELQGRLLLYLAAVVECERLLQLYSRATVAFSETARLLAKQAYLAQMREFERQQPDFDPSKQNLVHQGAFRAAHPEPYPTPSECLHAGHAAAMLAIVIFYQLLD